MVAVMAAGAPGSTLVCGTTIRFRRSTVVRSQDVRGWPSGVHLGDDAGVRRRTDALARCARYVQRVTWVERQLERLRAINPRVVDGGLAALLFVIGLSTVYTQDVTGGLHEAPAAAVLTTLVVTVPIAFRRSHPLPALLVACAAILVHIISDWPEGALPTAVLLLTYTVGSCETPRRASIGLGAVYVTL